MRIREDRTEYFEAYNKTPAKKAAATKYRNNNKQKLASDAKAYRKRTKEQASAYAKEYERRPKSRYNHAVRVAVKRGLHFNLTFDEYLALIGSGQCHYCQRELSKSGSGLDRKNNGLEYNKDTAVPCCWRCNMTFGNLFSYSEKLVLAVAIKSIDAERLKNPDAYRSTFNGLPV